MTIYSNITKSKSTPYFYIIKHIPSGKMYAGSRYANKCYPEEFLQIDGYQTSSKTIHKLIEKDGLNSFEILRIDTYCDGLHPHDYETLFLEVNNCAKASNWFNIHNNNSYCPQYGTDEFKLMMVDRYGIETPAKLEIVKNKAKKTKLLRYGDENYHNLEKYKQTCLEKYGVEHPNKRESEKPRLLENAKKLNARQDMIDMLADRNKNTNSYNLPHVREKQRKAVSKNNSMLYALGLHPMQKEENKLKASEKMKETMRTAPVITCPHCLKQSKNKSNMLRWHFDNCKLITGD